MSKGRFIVFEGIDGSGKATQIGLLEKKLISEGRSVSCYAFPQYKKNYWGRFLDHLLHGKYGPVASFNPYLMSVPYLFDQKTTAESIRVAKVNGAFVLADRFYTSNMGHQGGKIEDDVEFVNYLSWLKDLANSELGIPMPDQVIYLFLLPEISQKLMLKRAQEQGRKLDDVEGNFRYLQNSSKGFLRVAEIEGWDVVDCNDYEQNDILPIPVIENKIWDLVEPYV